MPFASKKTISLTKMKAIWLSGVEPTAAHNSFCVASRDRFPTNEDYIGALLFNGSAPEKPKLDIPEGSGEIAPCE